MFEGLPVFWTSENLEEFWYYTKYFLYIVAPAVLIWVALFFSGQLLRMVVSIFRKDEKKENEEFEIRHY